MNLKFDQSSQLKAIKSVDTKLSKRFIHLDSKGYFLIKLDYIKKIILVEHYNNNLDKQGRATDPETGKPIKCSEERKLAPEKIFKGRTAKEVGIQLTEGDLPLPISKLDHALYLGRELQKAEQCLLEGEKYIQD